MPNPRFITESLGHIATRQQLIAAGCSGYDLTIAVRTGQLRRVRQARYATSGAPLDAVIAARVGGMLAGPSAARSYGLWAGFDTRLHVSVGDNSARLRLETQPSLLLAGAELRADMTRRKVVVHWLRLGAVPELGPECWRVPLATCLRQMVDWMPKEHALACLDTALTMGLVTVESLRETFAEAPAADRLIASQARHGSDSGLESIVRQRCSTAGIEVVQQVIIPGVGRVDMLVKDKKVVIEADGEQFHSSPEAVEEDRRRAAELAARGYILVRLSYKRITTDWPWCERMICAALQA